jgi:undecaprenyl-diphosphatase
MSVIEAIILGLVQGLTEFIPISSSGHLIILHHFLGVKETGLGFDVALHSGTLIALLLFFWRDLWELFRAIFKKSEKTRLAWLLVAATIPGALAGFLLEEKAETVFRSVQLVATTMLSFGLIMLLADKFYQKQEEHSDLKHVSDKQALGMGLAQALAIIPGVSRSGSTITTGLFLGLDRVSATRFSFLLGIPITAGAILKVFTDDTVLQQAKDQHTVFIIGVLTALASGLFAIRFMLTYLSKHSLSLFAYYRIVLGIGLLLFLIIH